MITAVAFLVAAALGAMGRASLCGRFNQQKAFPVGTFGVNVIGSLTLGLLSNVTGPTTTVLGVGLLGSFTTFSGFVRDSIALVEIRKVMLSGIYVLTTLSASIGAACLGIQLAL